MNLELLGLAHLAPMQNKKCSAEEKAARAEQLARSTALLIRTGGQQRLSGFLLYGAEYSELFFSSKLWPEFAAADLDAALAFYHGAQRNFGR